MKVKVSHHAKQRANQRLNVAYKAERNKLFKRAIKYGHPPTDFAGDFNLWLSAKKKNKNVGIKVYDGNIFIYKNRLVITVFPVPERFLPIKDHYVASVKEFEKLVAKINRENISFEVMLTGETITVGMFIDDCFETFGTGKTEIQAKEDAVNVYLNKTKIREG